jgi:molecular chaperone GrpE (heat shock protein)
MENKNLELNNHENEFINKIEEKIEKIYKILEIDKTVTEKQVDKSSKLESTRENEFENRKNIINNKLDNIIIRSEDVYNRFIDGDRVISDKDGEIYKLKYRMEQMLEEQKKKLDEFGNEKEKYESRIKEIKKKMIENIMKYINFRDNIIMREDYAKTSGNKDTISVINSILKESAKVLEKCGVEILEGDGKFDNKIHKATGIVKTEDKTLHDMISKTFRPGYSYDGEILRVQEVVLYSYKKEEKLEEDNNK